MAETELAVVMSRHSSNGGANKHYLGNAQAQLSPSSSVALTTDSSKTLDAGCTTKANPHGTTGLGHTPGIDPDYIMQLVNDVRNFTDVLLTLKEALQLEEPQEGLQRVVQERLAELLRVLRVVCGKHQTLNSADVLSAAGTVIAKVKGVNFKEVNKKSRDAVFDEIYASIDTLAFTFGNVVSDFLMGDVDSSSRLGHPQARRCRSFENLPGDCGGCDPEKDDPAEPASPSAPLPVAEQVDQALLRNESGVESALLYAKAWSKYTKDLLAWVEKRLALDIECAKSFAKMAESAKAVTSQQDYMPFRDIYVAAFKNEIEYSQSLLQTSLALQANKFIQPLLVRKNELDKLRKDIKEQWQREQKKMQEAESAVRKAKQLQAQRKEEHERARTSTCRTEEEQPAAGGRTLEKKRRLEEDALLKAEEAQDHYRACLADAAHKRMGLANAKSEILTRIRGLVYQCDLTLKAVTVNWFQMQQAQAATLPLSYQALGERAKRYEPGQRYAQFVQHLPKERVWLEALSKEGAGLPFNKRSLGSSRSSHGNLSQASGDGHSADEVGGPGDTRTGRIEERRCNSSADIQALRTQSSQPSWGVASQGGGMCSDSESAGGSSESRSMDSPTASPGDFKRRLPRTPSTGTMSSADDLDEREPPSPSDNGLGEMVTETASSPGPFRNAQMSKAAHTHKLRKLRAPSKCRECDSLVVFHGAECEECSLACHKKCLETLAIQCGHKKLLGRLHLFGIDFVQAAKDSSDGIPFIIKKCTSEIESRALNIKGIYRVNGAKSRVEKLCQAFENGKDLVELSDLSPHDISNVLKLYLRQLPEPLILYRYYNEFIGLAKEAQAIMVDEVESAQGRFPGEQPCLSIELNRVVFRIRDLLRQLPATHYKTLQFLIAHLNRVTEKVDENKMTASNLGIIFGPTLIKPRQSEAEVSLSSLVDYPYQALMVELLIRHQQMMFDMPLSPVSPTSPTAAQGPLAGPHRDREPRLSRHSQSLMDIKEQSSKVYKRQSSLMPSSHSLDEAQELLAEDRQSTLAGEGAGRLNGVDVSASSGVQRSTLACGRPMSVSGGGGPVQLRTQASSRPLCRPISMPVDRLLSERNSRNAAERERSPAAIQETTEPERERTQTRPCSTYYRTPVIDTQTLRRTWDRQYKHYDVTPRTAMIVANLPSSGVTDKARSPVAKEMASPTCSVSNKFPNSPYMGTVGSGRASRRDSSSSSEKAGVPITFRAPRTLQPPPETFYKPPTKSRARPPHQDRTITTTVTTTATTVTAALDTTASTSSATATVATATAPTATASATSGAVESSEGDGHLGAAEGSDGEAADPGAASSAPRSPDSCSGSERPSPTEAKPLYQRLRSHRLHELERREAHFV